MKNKLYTILFLAFVTTSLHAQSLSRVTSGIDLGLGYHPNDGLWAPAGMYHQDLSLKNFTQIRVGWGVRAYGVYTGATNMTPNYNASQGDTLSFGKVSTNGLSFLASVSFMVGPVEIGANTDLVGIAFGTRRQALYSSRNVDGEGAEFYNDYVPASPSALNALPLLFNNNNGQSEIFARIWFTNRIGLKLGYNFGRTSYTSEEKLDNGRTRFSFGSNYPYVAMAFPLYN
ncbi:hypothetical protein CLV98_103468 [Dyadobacter jejuensis]|uniref:Outer membrane protein with beta-barrel domain n=1 Tax=Dyadobacter jejuensis TaxID=1082580 RepID=A0A316AMV0_9BACT|nr:hypothetical protein [Dyadobacter jejuensis]PWJ59095.1 hypothetical protein CLV98_103468 [Dyadobacter jejuensis]